MSEKWAKGVHVRMEVEITKYSKKDIRDMMHIWNEVVEEGVAFPQVDFLTEENAPDFFARQDYVGVAKVEDKVVGLYILHPNNVGRCGHQANTSYAVSSKVRGLKIGEKLVKDSLQKAKDLNYKLMIFNAVVKGNDRAIRLYTKLGFVKVGEIPKGFLLKDGKYQDIMVFYHSL